jgi:tetratricopeptide (TPR) repeat protein
MVGIGPGREGVDDVLTGRVQIDPAPEVAERRPVTPVRGQRADRDGPAGGSGPERLAGGVVAGRRHEDDALVMSQPGLVEHVETEQSGWVERPGSGRHADQVGRVVLEHAVQRLDEVRLEGGARHLERTPDDHLRPGCEAPDDARDKGAMAGVRCEHAALDRRVGIARDPRQPRVGSGCQRVEASVDDDHPHAFAGAAVRRRERIGKSPGRDRLRLGRRTEPGLARYRQQMIRRGDAGTEPVADECQRRRHVLLDLEHRHAVDESTVDRATSQEAENLVDIVVANEDASVPVQVLHADLGPVVGPASYVIAVPSKHVPDLDSLASLGPRLLTVGGITAISDVGDRRWSRRHVGSVALRGRCRLMLPRRSVRFVNWSHVSPPWLTVAVHPYNDRVLESGRASAPPAADDRNSGMDGNAPDTDVERLLALALSRPSEALAQATVVLAHRPDPRAASLAHQARGIVLRDSGHVTEALSELRRALRRARTLAAPERACDVRATLGVTLVLAGRTAAGLAELDAAAAASQGLLSGRVLTRRGGLLNVLGRHGDALADLKRAITLLHRGGDSIWEARARSHRFMVWIALGQAARADRDLAVAARLFLEAGQELESAHSVHNRADVAFMAGDLPAALGFLDEAAVRYAALSVTSRNLVLDRCGVLLAAGLASEALAETEEALRHDSDVGGQATRRAELSFAAARAAQAAGEPVVAAARAAAAREMFRVQGRAWWQARASFVGLQSRYAAGERGSRLRAQASRIADRLDELGADETPAAHLLAGRLAAELGVAADAERHFGRAAQARHHGAAFGRAAGWLAQALRAEARGAPRATLIACRRGLDAAAEHQRILGAPELRAYATAHGTELAAIAQRQAIRRGDARMLLVWTERWRASALAVPPVRPPDDQNLAAELAVLRDVVRRLEAARSTGSPTARLEQDRRRLESLIRARTRRISGAGTADELESAVHARPAISWGIDEIREGLGDHGLVEIIELDGTLYCVTVMSRNVRVCAVGPAEDAMREVDLARFMLRRLAYGRPGPDVLVAIDAAGRRLQKSLLGDAVGRLDGRPIVVVPPGGLHAVPWALLPAMRDIAVRVAPSVATWIRAGIVRAPRHSRVAFIVGPGLSGTVAEVTRIAHEYRESIVLAGGTATADRTLTALDGAWTAHIAAHGVFRTESPLFSSLLLDDGPLTVYDLGRLRRAPLRLVLSSCESGLAVRVGGDELLGMVSALVPLGTVSLLASVVPVNDAATVAFMVAFHDGLRAGSSFADALKVAQGRAGDDPVAVATALSFVALGR